MNASHKLPGWWTGEDEPRDAATAAAYDEMTRGDLRFAFLPPSGFDWSQVREFKTVTMAGPHKSKASYCVGVDLASARDIQVVTITHREELVAQGRDVVLVTHADITRGQEHVARLVGASPDIIVIDEAHIDGGPAWAGYGRGLSQIVGRTSWLEDCMLNLDGLVRLDVATGDTLKEREWADKARLKAHAKGPRKGRRR